MIEVCRYLNEPSSYVSSNLTRLVVLSQAVKRGKREGFDIVLCDTSGRTVVVTELEQNIFTPFLVVKIDFASAIILQDFIQIMV
jgi:signal recognition particle GTPase